MKIELTKNQQKLKDELKEYFSSLLNKALMSEMTDPQFFEGGGPEFKKALKISDQDKREEFKRMYKISKLNGSHFEASKNNSDILTFNKKIDLKINYYKQNKSNY